MEVCIALFPSSIILVTFIQPVPLSVGPHSKTTVASRYFEVCANCPLCSGCEVVNETTLPVCTPVLDHTTSAGGRVDLQNLVLDEGFWRVTPESREVLPCYNEEACLGGITESPNFCDKKYKGPCEFVNIFNVQPRLRVETIVCRRNGRFNLRLCSRSVCGPC